MRKVDLKTTDYNKLNEKSKSKTTTDYNKLNEKSKSKTTTGH